MTGCQGELGNQEFHLTVENSSGNEIINDIFKSNNNGFIDLWLPRNKVFSISIKYENKIAKSNISTYNDSNTCITTIQLE